MASTYSNGLRQVPYPAAPEAVVGTLREACRVHASLCIMPDGTYRSICGKIGLRSDGMLFIKSYPYERCGRCVALIIMSEESHG